MIRKEIQGDDLNLRIYRDGPFCRYRAQLMGIYALNNILSFSFRNLT